MSATVPPPAQTDLVTVTIDGVEVRVPKGTLLVEAAKQIHRDIPVYCYHTKLGPAGLCRVCLVEIEGMPKLQIACNTPVADGMKVHTTNPKVDDGRRAILEFFLLNHPLDCPICDKGGECDLQDYVMAYGQGASRLADVKTPKPKAVDLGPTIVLDEERCIVCQRCVRFDEVITHERSLRTEDRGAHVIIATATGQPYVSDFSGNVTELCPVGALTSKTYRFRSRPWDNHRTTTTCTQCPVGCAMHVDARQGVVQRTMMVEEDPVSGGWLCDRGRYNVGFLGDERRVTQPMLKLPDGTWTQLDWDDAIALWAEKLRAAAPERVAVLGGGRLLNEEIVLLARLHRALGVQSLDHRIGAQQTYHTGSDALAKIDEAQVIVTWGRSPAQLAPMVDLRIRAAVGHRGAKLFSLGDHAAGSFVPETRVATIDELREAVAALGDGATRIALLWDGCGSALNDDYTKLVGEWSSGGKSLAFVLVGDQPNGRGASALGMLPGEGGRDARGILEAGRDGALDVLFIAGANPVLRSPDRALVLEALRRTAFVVVTDLFMTETVQAADLVLPVCSSFEKSGTTTNLDGTVLPVHASVPAPPAVHADGDVLLMLGDALGVTLPSFDEIEAEIARAFAATPPHPDARLREETAGGDGLRVIVRDAIFTGGGTVAHDLRIGELRKAPTAFFAPATAERHGVREGDLVDLTDGNGAQLERLHVVLDPALPADAVGLYDGMLHAPANVFGPAGRVKVAAAREVVA